MCHGSVFYSALDLKLHFVSYSSMKPNCLQQRYNSHKSIFYLLFPAQLTLEKHLISIVLDSISNTYSLWHEDTLLSFRDLNIEEVLQYFNVPKILVWNLTWRKALRDNVIDESLPMTMISSIYRTNGNLGPNWNKTQTSRVRL